MSCSGPVIGAIPPLTPRKVLRVNPHIFTYLQSLSRSTYSFLATKNVPTSHRSTRSGFWCVSNERVLSALFCFFDKSLFPWDNPIHYMCYSCGHASAPVSPKTVPRLLRLDLHHCVFRDGPSSPTLVSVVFKCLLRTPALASYAVFVFRALVTCVCSRWGGGSCGPLFPDRACLHAHGFHSTLGFTTWRSIGAEKRTRSKPK